MRKLILLVLILLPLSCFDTLNSMYDDLTMKVPICVDASSTASSPDGRGWKNAYPSISAALADSRTTDGAEIWVKAGTYNISSTITISKTVLIFGGFNGTEERRNERSTDNTLTVLNGSSSISVAFDSSGVGRATMLDCFTIKGAPVTIKNTASPTINNCKFDTISSSTAGGALKITSASVLLSQCTFLSCSATGNGGAIDIANNSNVEITGCSFTSNNCDYGGAINAFNSFLNISNCSFNNNTVSTGAPGGGGAIYIFNTSLDILYCSFNSNTVSTGTPGGGGAIYTSGTAIITMSNSIFNGNSSVNNSGGAIKSQGSLSLNINSCEFKNNLSRYEGGALHLNSTGVVTINNSTISGNSTVGNGGGINASIGDIIIENSIITTNTASNTAGDSSGGGIYTLSNTIIKNSIISNNNIYTTTLSSIFGGGIFQGVLTKTLTIINSKITGNVASSADTFRGVGGAIYLTQAACKIYSTTISNNSAENQSSGIATNSGALLEIYNSIIGWNSGFASNKFLYASGTAVNMFYSCYEDSFSTVSGATFNPTSSIILNPQFFNPSVGDFTLQSTSPCRNTGNNNYIPSGIITDLAGNPRVVGSAVDIGAYEWQ